MSATSAALSSNVHLMEQSLFYFNHYQLTTMSITGAECKMYFYAAIYFPAIHMCNYNDCACTVMHLATAVL